MDYKTESKIKKYAFLNTEIEHYSKANSFLSFYNPKHGFVYIGNNGFEFKAINSLGFIKIPYKNIKKIGVNIIFKKYIRGIIIYTDDNKTLFFTLSKGGKVLKELTKHIKKDKFFIMQNNLKNIVKFRRNKK